MARKNIRSEKRIDVLLFFVLFGLIFVRYCYYGSAYFYQLDDYIQYHNYMASGQSLSELISGLGLLSARPLAGLFDLLVWSRFYGVMLAAVAVISALYAGSAVLFHRVFAKHFGTGRFFFIVYALLPLGFEGTYWVSASSRIVVGLFFAALSFYGFDRWCEKGERRDLVLFALGQLAAFCFYEQVALLSGALTLVAMLWGLRQQGKRRAVWGLLMFGNAALYFLITKLAPGGVYGARTALYLPWEAGYGRQVLRPACDQMLETFWNGFWGTAGKGLIRGLKLLASEPNALWMLAVLLLCFALFFLAARTRRKEIRFFAELFAGLFLMAAPLMIFFVLREPWFGLRNAVPSFCGLALVLDALFDLVFGRFKFSRELQAGLVAGFALLCSIASVSELHDYRETTLADTRLASVVAETFTDASFTNKTRIWLLNVDPSYVVDGNFYYHEHNFGCTANVWALTGLIMAVSGRTDIPFQSVFTPVSGERPLFAGTEEPERADPYWYTGDRLIPVSLERQGDAVWRIAASSGETLGTLHWSEGAVTLTPAA